MTTIGEHSIKIFREAYGVIEAKAMKFANLITKYRYRNEEEYIYVPDWVTETDSPSYCEYNGGNSIKVLYNIHGDTGQVDIPFNILEMTYEHFENMCIAQQEVREKQKIEYAKLKEKQEYAEYLRLQEKFKTKEVKS